MPGGSAGFEPIDADFQSSGETLTITIPANTLTVDGEYVYIEGTGQSLAAAQTPQMSWDGAAFTPNVVNANGDRPLIQVIVYRTGASSQRILSSVLIHSSAAAGSSVHGRKRLGDGADLTGSIDILMD